MGLPRGGGQQRYGALRDGLISVEIFCRCGYCFGVIFVLLLL